MTPGPLTYRLVRDSGGWSYEVQVGGTVLSGWVRGTRREAELEMRRHIAEHAN